MEQRFYCTDLLILKMKINLTIPEACELVAVSSARIQNCNFCTLHTPDICRATCETLGNLMKSSAELQRLTTTERDMFKNVY
jgi:hypothetical protein